VKAFETVTGVVAPLDMADVDTDQIIPKQFLRRIERSGFGPFLFFDRRKDPGFVLNQPQYKDAQVLLAGPNFGCGASREHAAWSLEDAGFRAVIAPSFGDIFRTNSIKIGLLPVELPETDVRALFDLTLEQPGELRNDLPAGEIAHVFRQTVFGTLLIWSLYGDDSLANRVHTALEVLWQGLSPRVAPVQPSPAIVALHRRLRHEFDPTQRLNPGRDPLRALEVA